MLQSTGNSPSIENLKRIIRIGEKWASENKKKLLEFIQTSREELAITYSGLGYTPAAILYWIITVSDPGKTPVLQDADTIALYRLAYREKASVIVFSSRGTESTLVRIADASRWTGGDILVISPKPPEILRELLRNTPLIETPIVQNEVVASLYESLLSLYTGIELGKTLGERIKKLRKFISEGYSVTIEELYEKYRRVLGELRSNEYVVVTSTKFLEPSAYTILHVLQEKQVKASYIPLPLLKPRRGETVLFVSSSVEESVLREKKMKAITSGAKVLELTLNVDPLELHIYTHILALLI